MQVSTVTLLPNDVIFKAFGPSRHHIGNIRFNALMESYYSIYNEFQFVDARAYKAKVIDRIIDNEINPGRFVRQNKDNNTYTLLERDHFRKMIRTRLSPSLKKKVSNTQRRVCLHKVTKSYWLSSESSTFQSTTTIHCSRHRVLLTAFRSSLCPEIYNVSSIQHRWTTHYY